MGITHTRSVIHYSSHSTPPAILKTVSIWPPNIIRLPQNTPSRSTASALQPCNSCCFILARSLGGDFFTKQIEAAGGLFEMGLVAV